jgi:long-chain acyl-CoA synthetase
MPLSGPPLDQPIDISDLLNAGLKRNPDATAMVSTGMRRTWRELDSVTDRLAANLLALGLKPGDRAATLMPNRMALLIFYISCFKAHLVVTPLNYRYTPREIDHALKVSGAALLFSHIEREADWRASRCVSDLARGMVTYGGALGSATRYEDLTASGPVGTSFASRDPAEPAAIFFTSGSTGPAKGVTHTVNSLGWMLASAASAFELTPQDVVLPGSSMSHLGSFLWSFAGLAYGVRVVVPRTFEANEILPLLRAERPTVMCMIPAALLKLVREHGATREDFASLRLCRAGSDKVPTELEAEFERLTGLKIDEGYGMTEVGLAALNPPSGPIKIGSIGRPVPGFEMVMRDDDGEESTLDVPGRLFMKTPSLTAGYWNDPAATTATITNGWIDSGDVMKVDADGYLWFCGRKKQIIVHDGSNIFPQEVEEALLDHPAVENAGVIGIHDLMHGENVRAYVSIRQDVARPSAQGLIDFARERVGYKAPEEIEFLDEVPLNATGKVDRVALKARASAHH